MVTYIPTDGVISIFLLSVCPVVRPFTNSVTSFRCALHVLFNPHAALGTLLSSVSYTFYGSPLLRKNYKRNGSLSVRSDRFGRTRHVFLLPTLSLLNNLQRRKFYSGKFKCNRTSSENLGLFIEYQKNIYLSCKSPFEGGKMSSVYVKKEIKVGPSLSFCRSFFNTVRNHLKGELGNKERAIKRTVK